MDKIPRVIVDKASAPRLVVDGEIIELEANLHPAYAELIQRRAEQTEKTLDRLIDLVQELIGALDNPLDALSTSRLQRDVEASLHDHEYSCDSLVGFAKEVADEPQETG